MIKTRKVKEGVWEIKKEDSMKVPGIVFASDAIMKKIEQDKTLEQVKNVAMLPGIVKASYAMPDAHQGYGFPVGGVAAFDLKKGIISPGGIGSSSFFGIAPSVIVNNFHLIGVTVIPDEADPPLVVDADAALSLSGAFESL